MALLALENLEYFADYKDKEGAYNATIDNKTRYGLEGAVKLDYSNDFYFLRTPIVTGTFFFGCAIYPELVSSSTYLIGFQGDLARNISIGRRNTGRITLKRNDTVVEDTDSYLPMNRWTYFEIEAKVTNSTLAGDVKIRINGIQEYSCSAGLDIDSSTNNTDNTYGVIFKGPSVASSFYYFTDMYFCDDTGTSNNTFLGPIKVYSAYPNGNGNSNQFTGSDADSTDNYLHVDDPQDSDDDTTYVESSTSGHKDLYGFENLSSLDTIFGVDTQAFAKKDNSGARTGKLLCRSGGTDYESSTFYPGSSYQYFNYIWEEDPNTSTAWTLSNLNSAEFGIKVES